MRALLLLLAVVAAGCAGSKDAQRSAASSTPVIRESPGLFERLRDRHQEEAQRESQAMTAVSGTTMR